MTEKSMTEQNAAVERPTRRAQAEAAWRENEERFRTIFDSVNDAIFVHDLTTGDILDVNHRMCEMYGYTRDEALRLTVEELSSGEPPYTLADALRWMRQAAEGEPQLFEWQAKDKGKRLFWVEVNMRRTIIAGAERLLVVVRDITERKRAEHRYRELFEEAPIMYVVTHNQDGIPVVADCNQTFLTALGYSRAEVQGRLLTDFYTPESRAKLLDGGYRRALDGQFGAEERRLVARDGRIIETLLTATPEVGPEGYVSGTRAMYLDITARKQAEKAFQESEERFRRLADNAPDVIYRYEVVPYLRLTYVSPAVTRITGYSPQELYADVNLGLNMVHPEDRHLLQVAFLGPVGSAEPLVIRWVRKDGSLVWTEHSHTHVYDSEGTPVAVEGIARDITQRKWAEEAVQQSEQRYRQRSAELVALYGISLQLNAVRDQADLLRLVVHQAVTLLGAVAGGVYLYDEQQDQLTFTVGVGYAAEFVGRTLKPGEGLAGRVFASHKSMAVEDYAHWPGRAAIFEGEARLKSLLAVPLSTTRTVPGVLTINGVEGQVFSEHDVWLVEMFASQASVALENARLHQETQRRARELDVLSKASQAMTSTLDLESVLNVVISEVRSLLDAEGASVALRDPATGDLVFAAMSGLGSEQLVGARIPANAGVAGWVVRERQTALVHDAQNDPRFWNAVDAKSGSTTRSLVAVPLIFKAAIWGVIEAINKVNGTFDQRDCVILEALARSAAIAVENARLYEAEREQRHLVEQSQMQLTQSEKLAATGRLAATLAHEINNPLQALSNCMQLMLNFELDPDERREIVELASSEVDRLSETVTRTLDFARRPQQAMTRAHLNEILEKVLALAGKYFQHRYIALQRDLAPDLPPILANPGELSQVFLNLVLNAVDAMPEGGTLSVVSAQAQDGRLWVTFSDTGCGISPESLPHIFEPFFSTKPDGTGLGLSVSSGVVSRHSGEITVQSRVNQGTTFTVWLPVAAH